MSFNMDKKNPGEKIYPKKRKKKKKKHEKKKKKKKKRKEQTHNKPKIQYIDRRYNPQTHKQ